MYQKVSTDMNFVEREKEVLQFWQENDIFRKSLEQHKAEGNTYTFYDGPPTANGKPHIGHVLTRVIKDMIPRYHAMKGAYVPRKAGWDTHGLPVEIEVEKKLGLDGKDQIEQYGIDPFIQQCKESVWKYKGMWEKFSGAVGFWADMDDPYVTYHDDYIESEWWALRQIWDKGLLYKGFKIVPYCPRCGTPLSSAEVAQGYKSVKERSAVVRFKVKGEDAYFLAWTTTPWTLPSNTALCVNPEDTYCKVKASDGYTYYMAEALLDAVLGSKQLTWEVLETMAGRDLERREYEPLYQCAADTAAAQKKTAHFVTCDGYVSMTDGTGIVHIAPAFGEDDSRVGRDYDLPFLQFVDGKGKMTEQTPFAGLFVKDADPKVLVDLDSRSLLFDAPKFEHDYPFCWRCDTPLIYYARESWYIRETAVRDDLVRNNNTVNWIPASIGSGRFGNWLENIQDWALSRNRYWGTPLNIWECSCGRRCCVGSREELFNLSGDERAKAVELHRPYIDEIELNCPDCGQKMKRVPEVIDCWFDSGAMPFAQYHYPFENKELFENQFPAQFISEAVDQTRGWFHSLMAESTLLFNKAPYQNVIVLGHVQDENGQKMSKSKGNAVDPMEALETYGADAIRWYFYTNSAPWLPSRFHGKAVQEGQRKFMGTLWNTYAFFVLYANIDNFDATKYTLEWDKLSIMDKWLLSRLNSAVARTDKYLADYAIPEACRVLDDFVDELSNWYVRRGRERYWVSGMPQDKINAYMTLYTALVTVAKLVAPMVPFMADSIYRNLVCSVDANAPISVHLCDYPVCNDAMVDSEMEQSMNEVRQIVELGRSARNGAKTKNRQPLAGLYVKCEKDLSEEYQLIVRDELNVKKVVFTDQVDELITYSFKPQLKTVGPKYGKQLGEIKVALSEIDGSAAKAELDANGVLVLNLAGGEVRMTEEDLLISIEQKAGYYTVSDWGVTVSLDVNLTPELIDEGNLRELISKVQTMRKEAGFEVTDHIRIRLTGSEKLAELATVFRKELCTVTLADDLVFEAGAGYEKAWDINGENITVCVEKL